MRIAIVSTDGVNVDEHFGKATRFLIYEIEPGSQKLLDTRGVTPLSVNDPKHPFDQDRFGAILQALQGCERVYCTKIGERPAAELKKNGIEPVIYDGLISDLKA